jgi:hypothetical protein
MGIAKTPEREYTEAHESMAYDELSILFQAKSP